MFIEKISKRYKGKLRYFAKLKCPLCECIFEHQYYFYNQKCKNIEYNDECHKCWGGMYRNTYSYKKNLSESLKKMYLNNPKVLEKKRQSMLGKNKGSANGMTKPEAKAKLSVTRKKMFKDNPSLKKQISDATKKAWADGKFDGVRVGQCKWYAYEHSNGEIYKVQGTWELKFIKWLDENHIDFICHRGRIPYTLSGESHNYYPDFLIPNMMSLSAVIDMDSYVDCVTGAYIDVKCRYFYNEDKFNAIYESNKDIKFKLLFKEDLNKLGVKI